MKRSERRAAGIQPAPAAPAPAAAAPADPAAAETVKGAGLTLGWRVALFIWASAFVCLLGYELLSTLVRSLGRLF